jgi:hypothetical protein
MENVRVLWAILRLKWKYRLPERSVHYPRKVRVH